MRELREDGILRKLHRFGFISHIPMFYLDLMEQYDICRKMGIPKMDSLTLTGEKFKVDDRTVYRALKMLKYEDRGNNSNEGSKDISGSCNVLAFGTDSPA